jgi:hypothetical protein
MPFDLYLVIGIVILAFAIPSIVSALSDGRAPRVAAVMVLIGGGLVVWAVAKKPGGYTLEDIPHAFVRVIGEIKH